MMDSIKKDNPQLVDLDRFFSDNEIDSWKKVLGEELQYHFGYFEEGTSFEEGQRQTVRNFFDVIPYGSRVLDAGCGWGGPARLLSSEHGCDVVGVTVSTAQAEYCRKLGIETHLLDLETSLPDGRFDVAIFMESLEHMVAKQEIIARVKEKCGRIIVSSSTWRREASPKPPTFGDSMILQDPDDLCSMLREQGLSVSVLRDRRAKGRETVLSWHRNFEAAFGDRTVSGHLAFLRVFAKLTVSPAVWPAFEQASPLLDIVAD